MPASLTTEQLDHLLAGLLRCVESLHSALGDTPAMRRVRNDAEAIRNAVHRLRIDVEELRETSSPVPCATAQPAAGKIQIPDAQYDVDFWRDADHEGVGAQSLACTRRHV